MKKIAVIMLIFLVIGFIFMFGRELIGFSFPGDWLVGPIIIIVCFVVSIVLGIYYFFKIK